LKLSPKSCPKKEKRRKFFDIFVPEEKRAKPKPAVESILKRPRFKKAVEKARIPEKKKEIERLAKITAAHIAERKEPAPALKITRLPKEEFRKLSELIKARAPSGRPAELRKEADDVFRKLKELAKKKRR